MVQARRRANEAITPSTLLARLLASRPCETRLNRSMTLRRKLTLLSLTTCPAANECTRRTVHGWVLHTYCVHTYVMSAPPPDSRDAYHCICMDTWPRSCSAEITLLDKERAPTSDLLLHQASTRFKYGVCGRLNVNVKI